MRLRPSLCLTLALVSASVHAYIVDEDDVAPRPFLLDGCSRRIDQEGRFRLDGRVRPRQFQFPQFCSLKILAPVHAKIRLSFDAAVNYQCTNQAFVVILDGWQISDGLRRSSIFIPESRSESEDRRAVVCQDSDGLLQPGLVETSQNFAEIAYLLNSGQTVDITVEFVPADEQCDQMLSSVDFGNVLTMRGDSGRSVCRWYVPGAVSLRILEKHLEYDSDDQCGDSTSSYFRIKSGHNLGSLASWKTICGVETEESVAAMAPCTYSVLELHSPAGSPSSDRVRFQLNPLAFEKKLIAESFCS